MLLTKLEIKGFKSFGEKVVFHFDKGVTAVVGPNGSGKSNVVDAIRWVLGEQKTKALRSEKMDNIIFNGTKNRKPLQLAEVSISFKNTKNILPTEYGEVTITRKYYRSGESEYLLNGVTCRLKDIQTLFMDTGVGSDSYAIIELKMVDEILNDANNARRTLFEEAAGISKFKKRKKETLRKLEETDSNIERVDDLLHEISKNLRSLDRQAKQAKKYLEIKEKYKEQSITLAQKKTKHQIDKLNQLQEKILVVETEEVENTTKANDLDSCVEKIKLQILNEEKTLSSRQKTLNEHVEKIRSIESQKQIKNEKIKHLSSQIKKFQEQKQRNKKNVIFFSEKIENLREKEVELEENIKTAQEQYLEKEKKFNKKEESFLKLKEEVNKVSNSLIASQQDISQNNRESETNQIELEALKRELEKSQSLESENIQNIKELESTLEKIETSRKAFDKTIATLEEKLKKNIANKEQINATTKKIEEERYNILRVIDSKEHEKKLLKSMIENLEGYPEAIRFLNNQKSKSEKKEILAEIITCEEKYRTAIENFLSEKLNYIIVEQPKEALESIQLLAGAAKGKANFFILSEIQNQSNHSLNSEIEGAIPVLHIIKFEKRFEKLIHWIFDNVYILNEDISNIPSDNSKTYINKNGSVIRKPSIISGGSIGLFEGKKIGRTKSLEKINKEITSQKEKLHELEKVINSYKEEATSIQIDEVKSQLDHHTKELKKVLEEQIVLKTRLESTRANMDGATNNQSFLLQKIEAANQKMQALLPIIEKKKEELSKREKEVNQLKLELENLLLEKDKIRDEFNEVKIDLTTAKSRLEINSNEIKINNEQLERLQKQQKENDEELEKAQKELEAIDDQSNSEESNLIELYKEKKDIEEGVNEIERQYYSLKGELNEVEKSIRDFQREKEQKQQLKYELKEKQRELEIKIQSIQERVSIEFSINLNSLEAKEISIDIEELEEEVQKIKEQLEKIGPVNHTAIEVHKEMQERHDFISSQKDDLSEAKESLNQTIKEIDIVAKENFIKAYKEIRENFKEVFQSLFTEDDDCDLVLSDLENPLESKIDIIARPKGKKPLTINQLSGGEKTLTATALLFAIYLLKPAPFCIFDEVDAPLDDANIDKFNNIIKKFSANSQFIIVTHNKRTMASTDIVYGVTMAEQGITTVVPVDLRATA